MSRCQQGKTSLAKPANAVSAAARLRSSVQVGMEVGSVPSALMLGTHSNKDRHNIDNTIMLLMPNGKVGQGRSSANKKRCPAMLWLIKCRLVVDGFVDGVDGARVCARHILAH